MGKLLGKAESPESLKSLRVELGMSQTELAQALGTTQTSVARWEGGSQPLSKMVLNHVLLLLRNRKLKTALDGILLRKEHWQVDEYSIEVCDFE